MEETPIQKTSCSEVVFFFFPSVRTSAAPSCLLLLLLLLPSNHYWGTNRPLCQTGRHDFSPAPPAHSPAASSACEWKRKRGGDWSVKSPLSPPSPSDRSDTTADDNNNNNDSDKPRCRIIHEGWRDATAKELSVCETHSLSSRRTFKAVPFMSYSPKLTPSEQRFPSQWRPPGRRKEGAKLRIPESKYPFSNLLEKFAVCHKRSSVAKTRQLCATPELEQSAC